MKNLIIAPHSDDEWLWCFSALNPSSCVVILSSNKFINASRWLAREIGYVVKEINLEDGDIRFSTETVKLLEDEFNGGWDNVYIPSVTTHQDHTATNDMCLAAYRCSIQSSLTPALYEYPYRDIKNFDYNTLSVVRDKKTVLGSDRFKSSWTDYALSLNEFIAKKHNINQPTEPFKQILRITNG